MKSKKSTLILFIFFAIANLHAQDFKPGLRGGLSLSTISEMHANYRPDFYFGGFGEINLTKKYALQPEINYVRQGSNNVARNYTNPETNTQSVEHLDLKLDYLSISMINKFTFGQGFQVLFGPSLDVRLNDNLVLRKNYNDIAFNLGLGYRMPSGLAFEARFKKGFLDILDSDYYTNDSNDHYLFGDYNTNINFQIGISYSFKAK
ncbi:outer membrane beta-barrel protein [Flavobacterium foetidum]|uniref:outer membrane beta-barrel protein n=1 Tax=Flavobacterium foetidum TaxID=2026681 RepID=UPI00107502AE|nr:outer membrane beta-barrel protein [Flavobacterium foetidum]KAF2511281.1 PorT family protein [Flavobacterium foetidum]